MPIRPAFATIAVVETCDGERKMDAELAGELAAIKMLLGLALGTTAQTTASAIGTLNSIESTARDTLEKGLTMSDPAEEVHLGLIRRRMRQVTDQVLKLARQTARAPEDGSYGPGLTVTSVEDEPPP